MKELTVPASRESIPEVSAMIDGELEALDCPLKAQMQIDVAVDEMLANITSYAYEDGTGDLTVRFDYDAGRSAAVITFMDSGKPFNPLEREDPDVTLSVEERQIGGLGIFLVKKTMDGMEYRRERDRNILTITKFI